MKISEILTEEELDEINWKALAAGGALAAGLAAGDAAQAAPDSSPRNVSYTTQSGTATPTGKTTQVEFDQLKSQAVPYFNNLVQQRLASSDDKSRAAELKIRNFANRETLQKFGVYGSDNPQDTNYARYAFGGGF